MNRRGLIRTSTLLLLSGLAGCSGGGRTAPDYNDWFDNVENFDGTVDRTDRDTVQVEVGAEGNDGWYAFEPAAVLISPGTLVEWRWTGKGGDHNVVSESGSFRSEYANSEGYVYSREFGRSGVHLYYCEPHRSLGMKGAIRVEG